MVNTAQRCYQRKHTQSNGCQKEMSFVSYFWLQRRWKIRLLIKDLRHWYAGSKLNTWDFNFKCFLLSHRLTVFLTKLGFYIIIGRLCHSSIQPLAYTRLSEYLSAAWWFVCCTQPITFIWCKGDLCRDNEVKYELRQTCLLWFLRHLRPCKMLFNADYQNRRFLFCIVVFSSFICHPYASCFCFDFLCPDSNLNVHKVA